LSETGNKNGIVHSEKLGDATLDVKTVQTSKGERFEGVLTGTGKTPVVYRSSYMPNQEQAVEWGKNMAKLGGFIKAPKPKKKAAKKKSQAKGQ